MAPIRVFARKKMNTPNLEMDNNEQNDKTLATTATATESTQPSVSRSNPSNGGGKRKYPDSPVIPYLAPATNELWKAYIAGTYGKAPDMDCNTLHKVLPLCFACRPIKMRRALGGPVFLLTRLFYLSTILT